jgi:MoxR-like ATPase
LEEKIKGYIVDLVLATRSAPGQQPHLERGASPRATLALANLSRARALLQGRDFVQPDDVRAIAPQALRHRIAFNYRVYTDGVDPEEVLRAIITRVPTP